MVCPGSVWCCEQRKKASSPAKPTDVYKKDEMPVRTLQLVCRAYTDNLIGISKAAELLNTDVSHALELCEGKENR